jgi:hypothetical protein
MAFKAFRDKSQKKNETTKVSTHERVKRKQRRSHTVKAPATLQSSMSKRQISTRSRN